jgi:hypothetical protein
VRVVDHQVCAITDRWNISWDRLKFCSSMIRALNN